MYLQFLNLIKDTFSFINGKLEVDCIDKYRNCFSKDDTGRLFRYLSFDTKRGLWGTEKPVGQNILTNCGKEIASYLRLENPHLYTGQCWRGSLIYILTMCSTLIDD